MLLKNSKGNEREVKLLYRIEKDNHIFLIFQDPITGRIFGSTKNDEKLNNINSEDIKYLNSIIERINGDVL